MFNFTLTQKYKNMLKFKEKSALVLLSCFFVVICGSGHSQKIDSCYAQGQQIINDSIPCCSGLTAVTEVDTNHKYCERKMSNGTIYMIWGLSLLFPFVLLLFAIFGIRNKLNKKKLSS